MKVFHKRKKKSNTLKMIDFLQRNRKNVSKQIFIIFLKEIFVDIKCQLSSPQKENQYAEMSKYVRMKKRRIKNNLKCSGWILDILMSESWKGIVVLKIYDSTFLKSFFKYSNVIDLKFILYRYVGLFVSHILIDYYYSYLLVQSRGLK